eukprot:CAMPEP_0197918932 /NCGR_PEP_ID=MMETSP1439-20131203/86306_1 /TAXON_ID=66791 /ORGANISM="Gonyaulax spinifera, Strain CCMP409" /LENGTH=113 /DNA_ID=CAMNT_0043541081 /DNA_START=15 /DNA_END=355 /DNA_ORIENTATION=+
MRAMDGSTTATQEGTVIAMPVAVVPSGGKAVPMRYPCTPKNKGGLGGPLPTLNEAAKLHQGGHGPPNGKSGHRLAVLTVNRWAASCSGPGPSALTPDGVGADSNWSTDSPLSK